MRALELRPFVIASLLALTAACSSSGTTASNSNTPTPDSGSSGGGDDGGGGPVVATGFKTHVILGDSISDRGGQGPFFYDLLDHNDDAMYPDYKGKDLTTKYGAGLKVVKNSKAGATTASLVTQAKGLPTSLDGPVLVTITIGGNDIQSALGALVFSGSDATQIATFQSNLDASLAEIAKPGRFGTDVAVTVLLANIYDPSDGTGTFQFANGMSCGQPLSLWNKGATSMYLSPWEDDMTQIAMKYPGVHVLDLHARFMGHGVPAMDTWFFTDCIHPNTTGHNQVRGLYWDAISAL